MNAIKFSEFKVSLAEAYLAWALLNGNEAQVALAEFMYSKHLASWYHHRGMRQMAAIEFTTARQAMAEYNAIIDRVMVNF